MVAKKRALAATSGAEEALGGILDAEQQSDDALRDLITEIATERKLKPGAIVIKPNAKVESLSLVASGSLVVKRRGASVVSELQPGMPVGELSFLTGIAPTVSVEAAARAGAASSSADPT